MKPIPAALAASAVLLAGAGAFSWRRARRARRADRPVPARPRARAAKRELLAVPLYKQWDPAWADQEIGGTGEKMSRIGCLVCCVAMVFSHYGIETSPEELLAYLNRNDGFTERGWLKWGPAADFSRGRARLDYRGDADPARIDAELAAGNPVIVKVMLPGGITHWVLVVGREGREYLVNDPLGEEKEPVKLSRFGEMIYAMRIFRKVAG